MDVTGLEVLLPCYCFLSVFCHEYRKAENYALYLRMTALRMTLVDTSTYLFNVTSLRIVKFPGILSWKQASNAVKSFLLKSGGRGGGGRWLHDAHDDWEAIRTE